jgi:hypothetical protein
MADPKLKDSLKDAKAAEDAINRLKDVGTEFSAVYQDIGKALSGLAKGSKEYSSNIKDAESLSKDLAKSAQKLAAFTKEDLKDRKKAAEYEKLAQDIGTKRSKIESQIRVFKAQSINASKSEQAILSKVNENLENQVDYTKQIGEGFKEINDTVHDINKVNVFDGLSEIVASVPVLNKIFPEFGKASKTFNDNMVNSGNVMQSLVKGGKELTGAFGKMALAYVGSKAVDEFTKLDERTVQFQTNLGLSEKEAFKLQDQMSKVANATGKAYFNSARFAEAQENLNSTLGTNATISGDMAENYSALVYRLGLSNDEATKFNLTAISLGKNSKTYTGQITTQVKLLNGQNKLQIDNRQILKDISNTSSRIQLSTKATGKDLATAVYSAKALGLNMAQLEKTADSLLDFESSIANEMEAELLTGMDLNLEDARRYALNNDMAGLAGEISKQGITSAKFGEMNRIQQESIAKSLGMQADELADSLKLQDQLRGVAKDSGYRDSKSLDDLKQKVMLRSKMKDAAGKEIGYEKALAELGNEELKNQVDAATLEQRTAEKQAKAADQMIEAFGPTGLQDTMGKLQKSIDYLAIAIGLLAGVQLGKTLLDAGKGAKNLFTMFKGSKKEVDGIAKGVDDIGKNAGKATEKAGAKAGAKATEKVGVKAAEKTGVKLATKTLGKAGLKSLVKKLPLIGALAGIGFGIQRAMEGDYLGAAGEVASGIASTVPGVGTIVSAGIDVGLAGRDIAKAQNRSSTPMAPPDEAADFISRPGQPLQKFRKDDIIVGGTSLGGGGNDEVTILLKELVAAVKAGGNVYLDATKVGTAMNVGTYRVQ